ncbi:hypothetical protein QQ054_15215 [Oscillatoria amoena NRMC-F 0135]|nr:hypothetical protein [Oscillatoria amoena NRMC-F 0135]
MSFLRKLLNSNFFIRLKSWEYWPFEVFQFPVILYWLWLSARARSLVFFSASNPGIPLGGMFGESKYDILMKIPGHLRPKMIRIKHPASAEMVLAELKQNEMNFPLVFKPDVGERGFMVERIFSTEDVIGYCLKINADFLIQELVDLPIECGVFYIRKPSEPLGKVTSLNLKEMLTVCGDGRQTLRELILGNERPKLQWGRLKEKYKDQLDVILSEGEIWEINSIGNHCLGTKFLNGEQHITPELERCFDSISKQIDGFFYGRYDLRCESMEALYRGDVKILELNGCGAEPAHIYEPNFPLFKAWRTLFRHWDEMYRISKENKKRGIQYARLNEALAVYKKYKAAIA